MLTIAYQARSPKTRTALVQSYRKLMTTTRAVQRDAATMVRRLGQRVRTASPHVHAILQRAQEPLHQIRPLVERVLAQTRARVLGGDPALDRHQTIFGRAPDPAAGDRGFTSAAND